MACNETMESIIAEMREFADTESQTIGRDVLRRAIQHFADRIEEAHERELVPKWNKLGNKTVTTCNTLNTKSPENVNSDATIYNVAKMRKALEIISRTELPPNSHTTEEGEVITYADGNKWLGRMRTAVALTKAALSEPPRNCDRFSNIREASIAFNNECPVDRDNIRTMTFNEWLFAEAKGEAK